MSTQLNVQDDAGHWAMHDLALHLAYVHGMHDYDFTLFPEVAAITTGSQLASVHFYDHAEPVRYYYPHNHDSDGWDKGDIDGDGPIEFEAIWIKGERAGD